MSQIDKLEVKIRRNPRQVTFREMRRLLENYGFKVVNDTGGSHFIVYNPSLDYPMKPLPDHGKDLKSYLVRYFLNAIDDLKN
ncbi:type II toxin-antitoxin system HicA family toxin [Lacticaseibacillus pantheris]|uniref:type II toxin-antitoxin system HicA family toxin n=1 Tax=Lacticaseibacillus pantheris TaxID=171523 RepID=UPI000704E7DE|nr:type II toxin-antitoxin system HicA family toxin [Lacticaseibacillus pantheris]